jgi:GNAT superfamily N-acetyltransferase
MHNLTAGYTIRSAQVEELTLLAEIERSAGTLFLDTPYAFLVDAEPLPLEFICQRFQAGQVWVAVADRVVIGYAIAREVDETLYLQEIDVEPKHGRRGIGTALIATIRAWAQLSDYSVLSLSTFRDIPWNAPFYAKLGFRILDESELTAGFQEIRRQELAAGLPIADRVIMYCEVLRSNLALERSLKIDRQENGYNE